MAINNLASVNIFSRPKAELKMCYTIQIFISADSRKMMIENVQFSSITIVIFAIYICTVSYQ